MSVDELLRSAQAGDRRSLARLLSYVESDGERAREVANLTFSQARGWVTGITGAPGAGKSTLTGALLSVIRDRGVQVAVLAVDPSSPFSGGAILGDRIRMGAHSTDDGVFIRSLATRGHLGGLSVAVPESARLFQSCGFADVLIETVGVGQVEIDIASEADTTVVVVNPGWGDSIQAAKAGLMEIADIFVVNKADRPGATETASDLRSMLAISAAGRRSWLPPVVMTDATTGEGAEELCDQMLAHRSHAESSEDRSAKVAQRRQGELRRIVAALQKQKSDAFLASDQGEAVLRDLSDERTSPWEAARRVVEGS